MAASRLRHREAADRPRSDPIVWLTRCAHLLGRLQIGAMTAFVVKACDRCSIPDTDQRTAVVGKAVRRALRTRKGTNAHDDSNTGVFFAQNLNHVHTPGLTIRLGDEVHVLARSLRPNMVLDADPGFAEPRVVARARRGA